MPHSEEPQKEQKEEFFRDIGATVAAVEQEAGGDDEPQIMDNIGLRVPLGSLSHYIFLTVCVCAR
jgi:hypothetical protein